MLVIDGSLGEGGGQVLRTSLALSLVTGTAVRVENIRAGRPRPGLARQHLACVEAARRVGSAFVEGAQLGGRELTFIPAGIREGRFSFSVGTAGSTTLVLQTILPALLRAPGPSEVFLEGGTHNPLAPPWDFLEHTLLPALGRMGAVVQGELLRHGFAPAGGGRLRVTVHPSLSWQPVEFLHAGPLQHTRAEILLCSVPDHVGQREADILRAGLGGDVTVRRVDAAGAGNIALAFLEREPFTEVVSAFGERGRRAEDVARSLVEETLSLRQRVVPVGGHLADQLLLPMALAGGGAFLCGPLSLHAQTQLELIPRFLPVRFSLLPVGNNVRVSVSSSSRAQ